jgi:hypothetical protein
VIILKEIKINSIIMFNYKNWKDEKGVRTCVVEGIFYGSNAWHKEEQFLLNGFDLDKNEMRVYAMKDMSDIKFSA